MAGRTVRPNRPEYASRPTPPAEMSRQHSASSSCSTSGSQVAETPSGSERAELPGAVPVGSSGMRGPVHVAGTTIETRVSPAPRGNEVAPDGAVRQPTSNDG